MSQIDYLGNQSPLSREEAELYSALERNGTARRITASHDLGTVRIFVDEEIETALTLLEKSTSTMRTQTRVLKLQQEALKDFQTANHKAQTQFKRITGHRQRHRIQEKQNTDLAIEELLQTTAQNAILAQRQSQAYHDGYPNTIAESLQQDDNILLKLEELSSTAHTSNESDEHQKARIQDLCARLIAYDTEEIRCRLDRKYIEAIRSSPSINAPLSIQTNDFVLSLKEELETLYPEIGAVSQMSVSQEFEAPLTQSINRNIVCREDGIRSALDNIDAILAHLERKTSHMTTRLQTNESHLAALNSIVHDVEALSPEAQSTVTTSPTKNHGDAHSPPSLSIPAYNLDSIVQQEGFPNPADMYHRHMLHLLGVSLNSSNLLDIQNTLDAAILDRQQKAKNGLQSLNHAIDSSLSLHLNNAACVNDLLLDGLLEEAKPDTIELFDLDLKSRSLKLGMEIDKVGADMAGLDMDKLHMVSRKREDFVNKWAS